MVAFAVPIAIWSQIGESIFGSPPGAPFGIDHDAWGFLLSLPVIFYSSWIFFRGAYNALRVLTLDMMVLVAVAIGTGWIYSVATTFFIEGEVFYEAAAFLGAFVLLATGSRCAPAAGRMMRSACSWILHRRRLWSSAMERTLKPTSATSC